MTHGHYGAYPNAFNTDLYFQIVGKDGDFTVANDMAKYDVTAQLKDLKMPILIVAGRYDRVSVPKFAVQYKKYCPQAQFVMFEKSGHNPMVEEPQKDFKIIREFLSK
jgi:proline iminopeptidase